MPPLLVLLILLSLGERLVFDRHTDVTRSGRKRKAVLVEFGRCLGLGVHSISAVAVERVAMSRFESAINHYKNHKERCKKETNHSKHTTRNNETVFVG